MNEKKNDVLAPAGNGTSSKDNSSVSPIIAQDTSINQGKTGGKRAWGNKKDRHMLHIDSKVRSLAVKCYEEQMPYTWIHVQNVIRGVDKKEWHVVAICHDTDTYSEDGSFWKTAKEKKHFHIIVRNLLNKSVRVGSIMKMLGIVFRPALDDELWKNHGVESVDNFAGYTTYLTHETDDAIRDGKEPYDHSLLVSNLTPEELDEVRAGYSRLSNGKRKVSADELVSLDDQSFQLGYDLKDFDAWYDDLPFSVRSNAKMKTIRESYDRGVRKRVEEKPEVVRLCVFIEGDHDSGKTYSSRQALTGKRVKTVEGGGTGKFDDLKPDHDAIIVSDDTCPNVLNMCDNYVCRAYKRQKNNPAWTGKYFIVTSNLSFDEWLKECGIKAKKHVKAMHSRFFICEIRQEDDGTNYLAMKAPSTRGSRAEQQERAGMFMDFQRKFNESIANYRPADKYFDYADMKDPEYRTADEQARVDEQALQDAVGIHLPLASGNDALRYFALQKFCTWFWKSSSGPWKRYLKEMPAYKGDIEAAKRYISEYQKQSLQNDVNQFIDYKLVGTFPIDFIREAVEWTLDPMTDMSSDYDRSDDKGVEET